MEISRCWERGKKEVRVANNEWHFLPLKCAYNWTYATFYCGLFSAESAFQMDLKLRAIRAHSLGTSLVVLWYERILNRAPQHTFMRALLTHMVGTHKYSVCMPSLTHSVAHYSQKRPPRRWAAHMHKLFPKINVAWQENLIGTCSFI